MKDLISVILPVYNSEKYVGDAISSILQQSYSNLELIIIDDLSTDGSLNVIESFEDARINIIKNSHNLGRAGCDNLALQFAKGRYIAKMDSDDIAHPQRLTRQIRFLTENTEVNTVGSFMQNFGHSKYLNKYPESVEENKVYTLFGLPCGNPSVVFRREVFDQGLRYNEHLRQTEDYDFFARYFDKLKVYNLQEPLMFYRTYPEDKRNEIMSDRFKTALDVRVRFLEQIGIPYNDTELSIHHRLYHYVLDSKEILIEEVEDWLKKIEVFNSKEKIFNERALNRILAEKYFEYCYLHTYPKMKSFLAFQKSSYNKGLKLDFSLKIKFLLKGILNFNRYNQ